MCRQLLWMSWHLLSLSQCGSIDTIGLIEPKASHGPYFIFIAINYFTKWVEVVSHANVTRQVVIRFIKKEIIFYYGIHSKIITDNRLKLNNKMIKELCETSILITINHRHIGQRWMALWKKRIKISKRSHQCEFWRRPS